MEVVPAEPVYFPGVADSNSPTHWSNGKRYAFNSDGQPIRSEGVDLGRMRYVRVVQWRNSNTAPWWIEATYKDDEGNLFAWYHHEQYGFCEVIDGRTLGVPVIGAAVSRDDGHTFTDLGFVLADGKEPNCSAENGYFAGGHGDFSVILDREKKYFYFFFSNYSGTTEEQGVSVARMAYSDRFDPQGHVWKFYDNGWNGQGLGGGVTAIFPVRTPWELAATDAFWGPSVHYNRELGEFVILLNRACCEPGWPAEGIYISFNANIENPRGWSAPERIIERGGWYPMAVGLEPGDTDKDAGGKARLFMGSDSNWELVFRKGQQGVIGTVVERKASPVRSQSSLPLGIGRRASGPQFGPTQVGTPNRGSTQRITAK